MLKFCGTPSESVFSRIESEHASDFIREQPYQSTRNISQLLNVPNIDPQAIDLIQKMVEFDPLVRVTAEEALNHPYFEEFSDALDTPKGQILFGYCPWKK